MARFSISATGQITHGDPVIGRPDVQQRPLSYVGVGLVAPSRRPASSTVVRKSEQREIGYILATLGAKTGLNLRYRRKKKDAAKLGGV